MAMVVRNDANANLSTYSTGASLNDTNRHHLAMSCDGSGVYLFYVDGVQYSETADTMAGTHANLEVSNIGASRKAAVVSSHFDGEIDDVRVYNRALTSNEVFTIYNNTKATYGL